MSRIVDVEARDEYRIWIKFEDGVEGEVDLSDLVGKGVFEGWTNRSTFRRVSVNEETGTVTWPGGVDLCPDSLYEEVTGESVLKRQVPSA